MYGKLMSWMSNDFRSMILDTLKVLFQLFSKQVNIGTKEMVFQVWAHELMT